MAATSRSKGHFDVMPPMDNLDQERRERLEARLTTVEAAQARRESGDAHRAMVQGYRFLGEVVGGVFMGAALGWAMDNFVTHTPPWGLVIGLFGGASLSIFVAVKTAARVQNEASAKAGPLPRVSDEDED